MRNNVVEAIVVGASIGLVVMAIRILIGGASSPAQVPALVLAGAVLCAVQIVLLRRRARRDRQASDAQAAPDRAAPRRRAGRDNPFMRELSRSWTGLSERPPTGTGPDQPNGGAHARDEQERPDAMP